MYGVVIKRMVIVIRENIETIRNVVTVYTDGDQETNLEEIFRMIYDMAMAKCFGLTEKHIKVIG